MWLCGCVAMWLCSYIGIRDSKFQISWSTRGDWSFIWKLQGWMLNSRLKSWNVEKYKCWNVEILHSKGHFSRLKCWNIETFSRLKSWNLDGISRLKFWNVDNISRLRRWPNFKVEMLKCWQHFKVEMLKFPCASKLIFQARILRFKFKMEIRGWKSEIEYCKLRWGAPPPHTPTLNRHVPHPPL